ncbi:poly-gamma-glutamate system protein [uncultured Cetobacterium sp.]|uniref:poly-gamma-glutamate system protein n=1 Tax=uncultured Cetobacterium sp. TaxID=527638 RepID=UPI00261FFFF0|nr:poly-gamma-glutamate system protein [uncultured Cetobacterium sp.]
MRKNKLCLSSLVILILFFTAENIKRDKHSYYNEMKKAQKKMTILSKEVLKEKKNRGIEIDRKIDLNRSGLLGEEFTGITTTLGDLDSKRASTNPDFAAYFVKKFKEKNLEKGDLVYVNMSSSFPGLNLSIISALDILELDGIIVNSIGSSMYGANNEEFTFLEMGHFLKEKKMIQNEIKAYSLGGDGDLGKNFDEDIKIEIEKRIEDFKIEKIKIEDFKLNLENRIKFYNSFGRAKYFVNIGGNFFHAQLETYYKNKNIPVLSMLNIKQIASDNGISIDGKLLEKDSGLYYKKDNKIIYWTIILIFFGYLYFRSKKIIKFF